MHLTGVLLDTTSTPTKHHTDRNTSMLISYIAGIAAGIAVIAVIALVVKTIQCFEEREDSKKDDE
jgi:cell division protein FtsN